MIIADVLKRWKVLLGETDARLLTGTDEHGMKVQTVARMRLYLYFDCRGIDPAGRTRSANGNPSFLRYELQDIPGPYFCLTVLCSLAFC